MIIIKITIIIKMLMILKTTGVMRITIMTGVMTIDVKIIIRITLTLEMIKIVMIRMIAIMLNE